MTRVAFDDNKKAWVDLNGLRNDISIEPDLHCYYYHLPDTDFVLKAFENESVYGKELGEIITRDGKLVNAIPFFQYPSFCADHKRYKCRIAWVQGYENDEVLLVVNCSEVGDLRVRFNLKTMEYSEPNFNVR